MSPAPTSLQVVFLECLRKILSPVIKLTLRCGLGYSEFEAITRKVFVEVASDEFGDRGRPANISRVSAKTGLSRKSVQRYRVEMGGSEWVPDYEDNPINTIIHYWRFDPQFCLSPGSPRELALDGDKGFVALARKYVGDIPTTAVRQVLLREGIAEYAQEGTIRLIKNYSFPDHLDEDFLRNAAFAIGHHAETVTHNAALVMTGEASELEHRAIGRFERIAWSRRLTIPDVKRFQLWVREEGSQFIEQADEFISRHESNESESEGARPVTGVGVYFFRSD